MSLLMGTLLTFSPNDIKKIKNAYKNKDSVNIRLTKDDISNGKQEVYLPNKDRKKIMNKMEKNKGHVLSLSYKTIDNNKHLFENFSGEGTETTKMITERDVFGDVPIDDILRDHNVRNINEVKKAVVQSVTLGSGLQPLGTKKGQGFQQLGETKGGFLPALIAVLTATGVAAGVVKGIAEAVSSVRKTVKEFKDGSDMKQLEDKNGSGMRRLGDKNDSNDVTHLLFRPMKEIKGEGDRQVISYVTYEKNKYK